MMQRGAGQGSRRLTWLASYPKSGNTWVRAFLSAYGHGDPAGGEFDLALVPRASASESHGWRFAEATGKPFGQLSEPEIDAARAAVQRRLADTLPPHQVIKTHNTCGCRRGTPLIRAELTARAVYVVRNPLDVVDSLADHAGCSREAAVALLGSRTHKLGGPDVPHAPQFCDSWSHHVTSWTSCAAFPVKVLRYEDLLRDPQRHFSDLLRFLQWEVEPQRLVWAIEQTSFDSLRTKESRAGFVETSPASTSGTFFRRGKMGRWSEVLTHEQIQRVIRDHGQVMTRLGYEIPEPRVAKAPVQRAAPAPPMFIPADWKGWVAENLLLGQPPARLVAVLVEHGFPEPLSRSEVDAATSHPYVAAAQKLLRAGEAAAAKLAQQPLVDADARS